PSWRPGTASPPLCENRKWTASGRQPERGFARLHPTSRRTASAKAPTAAGLYPGTRQPVCVESAGQVSTEGRKGRRRQKGAEQPARVRNNRAPFWRAAGRHRFQGRNAKGPPGPRAYRGPSPARREREADGSDVVSERFREGYSE